LDGQENKSSVSKRSTMFFGYLFAIISAALFGSISTVAKPALSETWTIANAKKNFPMALDDANHHLSRN